MEATTLPLRVELGTTTTAEGLKLFRGEVERGTVLVEATDWTEHPVKAMADGRDLLAQLRSDDAYREARYEARQMFATAS